MCEHERMLTLWHAQVVIIDPHIKRDDTYALHASAHQLDLYVKDESGKEFEGHWYVACCAVMRCVCIAMISITTPPRARSWPGASSWLDYTDPRARQWCVQGGVFVCAWCARV
jgi:alpha 1,3-glucosidase